MQSWWDRFMRRRQALSLSHLRPRGFVQVKKNGLVIAEDHNMIVQTGLNLLANKIFGGEDELPNVFHFGTNSASTLINMTGLQGTDLFQKTATTTKSDATMLWKWTGTYTGETVKVGEIGIFNSTAVMLARFVPIPSFDIQSGDALEISWQITLGE